MSFARIAEARAVKKIVAYLYREADRFADESGPSSIMGIAEELEAGKWKDIQLPRPEKKAKKKK